MAVQEEALIRRAASGDDGAFEALVLAHQKQVYNLCLRLSGSPEDAYDLSQEAFIKAWRGLAQYQFGAEFSTWLYRLTRNVCIDHLRQRKRRPTVPLETEQDGETAALPLPDSAPGPEERALQAEKQRVSSETLRNNAEAGRSTAESGRRSAETARVNEFNAIKAQAEALIAELEAAKGGA